MTAQYETGAQRLAREQAELAALTGEGQTQDPATDTQQGQAEAPLVDWEKRYKDLQSHSAKQITDLQSQVPAGNFETENEALHRKVAELHGDLEARNVADKVTSARQAVASVHPDFEQIIPTQEFTTWIESQPAVFKESIYADVPDAALANQVLTLYKAVSAKPAPQAQAQQQPDPASMAQGRGQRGTPQAANGPKVWSMAEISKMNPNEYAANAQAIDTAMAEGRIRG